MLCLTRRKGERIVIGDNIILEVLRIRGEVVSIGITAPKEVEIMRAEVWDKFRGKGLGNGTQAKK